MIPVFLTCLLGASVMAIVARIYLAKGFIRGCVTVTTKINDHLAATLPIALDAAKRDGLRQGAENAAKLLLPLLASHGLEMDAIALLTSKRDELAAKGLRN